MTREMLFYIALAVILVGAVVAAVVVPPERRKYPSWVRVGLSAIALVIIATAVANLLGIEK